MEASVALGAGRPEAGPQRQLLDGPRLDQLELAGAPPTLGHQKSTELQRVAAFCRKIYERS